MLSSAEFFGWQIAFDRAATQRAYELVGEGCSCGYCRNFAIASSHLPPAYYHLLRDLGIDANKPAEVVEYQKNPDGTHYYGWWFHVIGTMHTANPDAPGKATSITAGLTMFFWPKDYLLPASFSQPVLQVEFFGNLPWLLDEPDD